MTRRPSFILDLPFVLLVVPPVLFGLGLIAVEWIDLPPMPWSGR
ncbi:hypothetical protein [Methylorubrum extorquens]|nr:hypothetical protein [Methylorubrum extorquens]UYW33654.1 hypothetical protein OKB92_06110 [Methylorubrum extorquens]